MSIQGILHLIVVYIVWGSTYLAIRVAVREDAGFPPFTMAATRVLAAAAILLLWGRLKGQRFRLSRRQLVTLATSALLLWVGGNGLVSWAEMRIDSGLAALLVGSMPIWTTIIEAIIDRRPPSWRLAVAMLVGFAGVGVLYWPLIQIGSWGDILAALTIVIAAISWGTGAIIQQRRPFGLGPQVSSGYQQAVGFLGLMFVALLMREPAPQPIPEAWAAWGYLIVFGSVLAFTSFVRALQLLPVNIVMTYAYVNPVIAVILGWIILGEEITVWTMAGTVLIVLGVMGVFHEKRRHRTRKAPVATDTAP
jgi:drug/metabolite transporter (DMT)-like permease